MCCRRGSGGGQGGQVRVSTAAELGSSSSDQETSARHRAAQHTASAAQDQ